MSSRPSISTPYPHPTERSKGNGVKYNYIYLQGFATRGYAKLSLITIERIPHRANPTSGEFDIGRIQIGCLKDESDIGRIRHRGQITPFRSPPV